MALENHGSPIKSHFLTISCSVLQSCLTLCNPMDCSTPGRPILHHLPEPAQTHAHHVDGAIQPPHPLFPPSLPALNLSQHQCLFLWIGSLHQVAKVLGLQLQHQSSQWIFRVDFLYDWLVGSPFCPRDSQAPQFKSISFSVFSLLHGPTLTSIHDTGKAIALIIWTFVSKVMSVLFNVLSSFVIAFLPKSKHL